MDISPRFLASNSDQGSQSTQIKVCGITRIEDALFASRCGVEAIGLIFYPPSGRNLSAQKAKSIRDSLPPEVASIAVVVNPDDDLLDAIVSQVRPTYIQFHGDESEQRCQEAGLPFIKALRVRNPAQVAKGVDSYPEAAGLLLDAYVKDKVGGTGRTFSWDYVPQVGKPIILAGGLHSGNIAQAISKVGPTAVDVSTGVEFSPGVKNQAAIREFVTAVRSANNAACLN